MAIGAAHIDSPRLDLKQNPIYEADELGFLKTHYYGGIRKYQWVTIPLEPVSYTHLDVYKRQTPGSGRPLQGATTPARRPPPTGRSKRKSPSAPAAPRSWRSR